MSIGVVMFLKALLIAICAAVWDQWQEFKKSRGLRLTERNGVYVLDDRLERCERYARRAFYVAWGLFAAYGVFVAALLILVP